ncbi:MAG: hypothetical protein COU08_04100 [Candidatus Harrisonbacteria bacterium CG10_big_fil_rev_8_21_14_0_10_42_17]|uniref:ATP synthase subunit b n=1 Tax=Candidatus Harrisonbacteria bacterium CG10_big_fil_rev_8_21_14_0_10_42_17 TaxID=1974584 RepID=A0A2M6WGT0_9BACT|nr:MAG: hypothetical protein COU08_04100 [Candidatus Harrisonbacteria bacterium CG10_big_fil_rev_8_21_14_0_10_42_17]
MKELLQALGIDWKLLLAQAVNFLIVLIILRLTIYKPVLNMLKNRRIKIEKGLQDAEEAGKRLEGVAALEKERLAKAEKQAITIVERSEGEAKAKGIAMTEAARKKEIEIIEGAERAAAARQEESREAIYEEAAMLIKSAIAKTANTKPEHIDDQLIKEAVQELKKAKA